MEKFLKSKEPELLKTILDNMFKDGMITQS